VQEDNCDWSTDPPHATAEKPDLAPALTAFCQASSIEGR
jgi:hypothetical protein